MAWYHLILPNAEDQCGVVVYHCARLEFSLRLNQDSVPAAGAPARPGPLHQHALLDVPRPGHVTPVVLKYSL